MNNSTCQVIVQSKRLVSKLDTEKGSIASLRRKQVNESFSGLCPRKPLNILRDSCSRKYNTDKFVLSRENFKIVRSYQMPLEVDNEERTELVNLFLFNQK